jgi:hypothetical protein
MGEKNADRILVGKPEGKRLLGRPRCRSVDYITCKINIIEMVCGGMDWIDLAHVSDRWRALVNPVINLWVS